MFEGGHGATAQPGMAWHGKMFEFFFVAGFGNWGVQRLGSSTSVAAAATLSMANKSASSHTARVLYKVNSVGILYKTTCTL